MVVSVNYKSTLDRVHQTLLPRVYVEIGVHRGDTLSLALPCTDAIGVDPQNQLLAALNPNARLCQCTSDDFFDQGVYKRLLGERRVDMAFVDGMHLFEFALRDILNLERHAGPDSVIFVHDCIPKSNEQTSRQQVPGMWTGDVWKSLWILANYRPDLDITILRAAPTGLAMIRNLDPNSTALEATDPQICELAERLPFSALEAELLAGARVLDSRWDHLEPLLPSPFQKRSDVSSLVRQRDEARADLATQLRRLRHKATRSSAGRAALRLRREALSRLARP